MYRRSIQIYNPSHSPNVVTVLDSTVAAAPAPHTWKQISHPPSLDRKVICSPNARAHTLLFLHAEVEDNISRTVIPSHGTPVPPAHDILVLHTRGPIWLMSEDWHLGVYFSSACQRYEWSRQNHHCFICLRMVKRLVRLSCQCGDHGENPNGWTGGIYFSQLTDGQARKLTECLRSRWSPR